MLREHEIAVCISGIVKDDYETAMKNINKVFPYDTFFLTWKGREKPNVPNCLYVDEPIYDYHCIIDTSTKPDCKLWDKCAKLPTPTDRGGKIWWKPNYYNYVKECSKQHLAHYYLISSLPEKYKTIIRIRYDLIVSTKVDFKPYIEMAQNGTTVGFVGSRPGMYNPDIELIEHRSCNCNMCSSWSIWDNMYFHKRDKFKNVDKLHEKKNLLGSEWGLYQILCHQWGNKDFLNVWGGNVLIRYCSAPSHEWINL
jgi:hypothetical protein